MPANINPLILAVLASFFFALSTFISKLIGMGLVGDPIHPFQVSHARFGFGLVGASLLILYFGENFSRPNFKLHLLRCTLGWLGVSILFTGHCLHSSCKCCGVIIHEPNFRYDIRPLYFKRKD